MADRTPQEQFERNIQPLDYSADSGSVGTSHYPDGPQEHDGRAETHTTFRPSEASNQPHRDWDSMAQVQDGKYANDTNTNKVHANQRRDLKTFFNTVDLSNWEEKYALCLLNYLHKQIDENDHDGGDEDVFYHDGDSLLLAIITFAANKNDRRIRGTDGYEELLSVLNVTRKDVRTSRKDIRDQRES